MYVLTWAMRCTHDTSLEPSGSRRTDSNTTPCTERLIKPDRNYSKFKRIKATNQWGVRFQKRGANLIAHNWWQPYCLGTVTQIIDNPTSRPQESPTKQLRGTINQEASFKRRGHNQFPVGRPQKSLKLFKQKVPSINQWELGCGVAFGRGF